MTFELGFDSQQGAEIYCFLKASIPPLGPTQPLMCARVSFPCGKATEHEAEYMSPYRAVVKNTWSYASTSVRLHRANFTFAKEDNSS
jgi:hypothetical protein